MYSFDQAVASLLDFCFSASLFNSPPPCFSPAPFAALQSSLGSARAELEALRSQAYDLEGAGERTVELTAELAEAAEVAKASVEGRALWSTAKG